MVFLVVLAAENLKIRFPPLRSCGTGWAGIVFLVFLAAENLQNTIPSSPVVGLSGNRVFGVFNCPHPQKYDSLFSCRGAG